MIIYTSFNRQHDHAEVKWQKRGLAGLRWKTNTSCLFPIINRDCTIPSITIIITMTIAIIIIIIIIFASMTIIISVAIITLFAIVLKIVITSRKDVATQLITLSHLVELIGPLN